jgi:hypothetical protein
MKNMKKFFILVVLLSGFVASSFAQKTASATASANIITPINIDKNLDMNFGNIAVNPTSPGGTVTLPAAATAIRQSTGGISFPANTGIVQAAKFTVTGEGTSTYAITGLGTINISDGASHTMPLVLLSNPLGTGVLTLGSQIIYVGGTLTVDANQAVGLYNGNFNVTVNYN